MRAFFIKVVELLTTQFGTDVFLQNTELNSSYEALKTFYEQLTSKAESLTSEQAEEFFSSIFSEPKVVERLTYLINTFLTQLAIYARQVKSETESEIQDVVKQLRQVPGQKRLSSQVEIATEAKLAQIEDKYKSDHRLRLDLSPGDIKSYEDSIIEFYVKKQLPYEEQCNLLKIAPAQLPPRANELVSHNNRLDYFIRNTETREELLEAAKQHCQQNVAKWEQEGKAELINFLQLPVIAKGLAYLDDMNFERLRTSLRACGLSLAEQMEIYPIIDDLSTPNNISIARNKLANIGNDDAKRALIYYMDSFLRIREFSYNFNSSFTDNKGGNAEPARSRGNLHQSRRLPESPNYGQELADYSAVLQLFKQSVGFSPSTYQASEQFIRQERISGV